MWPAGSRIVRRTIPLSVGLSLDPSPQPHRPRVGGGLVRDEGRHRSAEDEDGSIPNISVAVSEFGVTIANFIEEVEGMR